MSDPDDSWRQTAALLTAPALADQKEDVLEGSGRGCIAEWTGHEPLLAGQPTDLRFVLHDSAGKPLALEPYLGMAAHLVVRRQDGAVFTHLHPGGSFSMAAQQLFEMRADGRAPLKTAHATNDPICRLPTSEELAAAWQSGIADAGMVSFPYAFPQPGTYRLWLQFKTEGEVRTAVFDLQVKRSGAQG